MPAPAGYVYPMTETPKDFEGAPREEDVERAARDQRVDVDPEEEPNAPNREPTTERVGPMDADPVDQPGPLPPGENDPDRPTGVESYERPGRDGNWDADSED